MLRFIFKNCNRTLTAGQVISSPTCTRLYLEFTEAVKALLCSNHNEACAATVLLDISHSISDWQIISSCCPDYKQAVETAISSFKDGQGWIGIGCKSQIRSITTRHSDFPSKPRLHGLHLQLQGSQQEINPASTNTSNPECATIADAKRSNGEPLKYEKSMTHHIINCTFSKSRGQNKKFVMRRFLSCCLW